MASAHDIPGIRPDATYREAAASAVETRAGEVFEHWNRALDTNDIEGVHDMRVATRRLRAAMEIFAPCFPKMEQRRLLKQVKNLADVLGERRDPDVMIDGLEKVAEELAAMDYAGIQHLEESLRARQVRDLEPDGPLTDNMRRVILVRLEELHSFIPDALDPRKVEELHDMRIASKRLRYLLELSDPVFGKPAKKGAKVAKDIQGMLGEIHDCDELLPLVESHVARMRTEDAAFAVAAAPDDAEDLDPAHVREAPNRTRYRGLELLMAYTEGRRSLLHSRFVREWRKIEASGFRAELEKGLEPPTREAEPPREPEDGQEST